MSRKHEYNDRSYLEAWSNTPKVLQDIQSSLITRVICQRSTLCSVQLEAFHDLARVLFGQDAPRFVGMKERDFLPVPLRSSAGQVWGCKMDNADCWPGRSRWEGRGRFSELCVGQSTYGFVTWPVNSGSESRALSFKLSSWTLSKGLECCESFLLTSTASKLLCSCPIFRSLPS